MRVIHAAKNATEAHLLKAYLEERGIQTALLNEALQSAQGDFGLAPNVATQVAILDPRDEARALEVLEEMLAHERGETTAGEPWTCPVCGEVNAPAFEVCWQCATAGEEVPEAPRLVSADAPMVVLERPPYLRLEIAASLAFFVGILPLAPWLPELSPAANEAILYDSAFRFAYDLLFLAQAFLFTFLVLRLRGESPSEMRMPRPVPALDTVLGAGICATDLALTTLVTYLVGPFETSPVVAPPSEILTAPLGLVVVAVLGIICAAVAEEIYFRAYLLRRLEQWFRSPARALFWSAVAFGCLHSYQGVSGVAKAFVGGLLLGAFVLLLRRVWPVAISHVLYNLYVDLTRAA